MPLPGPIRLEPAPNLMVLVRVQTNEIHRVRTLSGDRQVDAGGLQVYWLGDVNAAQSVEFLKTLVTSRSQHYARPLRERVVGDRASSRRRGGRRDSRAREKRAPRLRQRALVWIARRAESQAVGIISQAIDNDPDVEVKRQAVSALSQLPRNEGIPLLIKLARSHTNPVVRKQAMHRLGQSTIPAR